MSDPLTLDEIAELRSYLPLLRALFQLFAAPTVDRLQPRRSKPPKVYPVGTPEQEARLRAALDKRLRGKATEPTAEDYAEVRARRRRKARAP